MLMISSLLAPKTHDLDTHECLMEVRGNLDVTDNMIDYTSDQRHEGGGAHGHQRHGAERHALFDVDAAGLAVKGVVPRNFPRHHPLPKGLDVPLIPRPIGGDPTQLACVDHGGP